MGATEPKPTRRLGSAWLIMASLPVLIVAFQNCAVDLSSTTPGASTWSSCGDINLGSLSESELNALISSYRAAPRTGYRSSCMGCHGVNTSNSAALSLIETSDNLGSLSDLEAKANICTLARAHKKFRDRGGASGAGLEAWLRTSEHIGFSSVSPSPSSDASLKALICYTRQNFGITGPPPTPDICL